MRVPGYGIRDTRCEKRAVNLVSRITQGLRESGYKGKPLLFKMLIEGEDGIDP